VTGQPVRWWRPPYGVLTASSLISAYQLGMTPVLWKSQVTRVQRRVVWIQASPGCRVMREAMAKAKGTVKPT